MAEKVIDLDGRLRVLETRARRIDDMHRLGRLAYRIVLWTGTFVFGFSTVWALWADHWGWWWRLIK
jgi:hypothetical protein